MTSIARRIALLADRQRGPFERNQLIEEIGLSERQVEHMVATEQVFVLFPGVYALTPRRSLPEHGWLSAAVLACGDGALAGRRSSGLLHTVVPRYAGWPEVTVPRHNAPRLAGIRTRSSVVLPYETTTRLGIPTLSLPRTMLDLANVQSRRALTRSFQLALRQGLTINQVDRTLADHFGERGTAKLRAVVDLYRFAQGIGKGGFEDAFYEFLLTILPPGFPRPERNVHITLSDGTWIEADLLWRSLRQIFELDFWDHHGGDRLQTTLDVQRDRDVRLDGWKLERFTNDEFEIDRARVARDVKRILVIE